MNTSTPERVFAPAISILEASRAARKKFNPRKSPRFNLILAVDSYKLSHAFVYPKAVHGMAAYIEARTKGHDIMIPFGRQAVLQKMLNEPINQADIEQAADFAARHGEPFARDVWEHILEKYNGYMPLHIRGVPEGTPVRSGNAITTIMCTDEFIAENMFWLCSYFETMILRGEWYPMTIATDDYKIKREIKYYYEMTGAPVDGPTSLLPFALHDFGGRGVTCHEQAEIGGAAHLVSFMGSDTIEGVLYANYWYHEAMAAYSVPATEHSVQCSFSLGKGGSVESELAYVRSVLQNLAKPGGVVSIVIDGYDSDRLTLLLCTELHDEIIACGAKVVFRPDSGDMMINVPRILQLQERFFGFTLTDKGFKKINTVGVLQGDGVDHLAITSLLGKVCVVLQYSADCVLFGSGGALLQKVNRDTYKFAQKASAVLIKNDAGAFEWVGVAKDPITDPGKKSKEGVLTLVRSRMTGEQSTARIDLGPLDSDFEDMMVDIYDCGEFFNETTLAEIRARAV
jgi:nicotinamide phosphoribosyltransferase